MALTPSRLALRLPAVPARAADEGKPIEVVASGTAIRRGESADWRCYNLKTKDRFQTPEGVFWFSNQSVRRT